VALASVAGNAVASESGSPCTAIQDDAARLACYDNTFGRPAAQPARTVPPPANIAAPAAAATAGTVAAATAGAASPAIKPAAPLPVEKQVEQFGLDPEAARKQAAKTSAPPPVESIESTVTGAKRRDTGELVLTLANGQVWMQSQADSKVWIKPGDVVTIKKAAFGSYLMVSGYYSFKVRRIS
jgi:hypothetical protein